MLLRFSVIRDCYSVITVFVISFQLRRCAMAVFCRCNGERYICCAFDISRHVQECVPKRMENVDGDGYIFLKSTQRKKKLNRLKHMNRKSNFLLITITITKDSPAHHVARSTDEGGRQDQTASYAVRCRLSGAVLHGASRRPAPSSGSGVLRPVAGHGVHQVLV